MPEPGTGPADDGGGTGAGAEAVAGDVAGAGAEASEKAKQAKANNKTNQSKQAKARQTMQGARRGNRQGGINPPRGNPARASNAATLLPQAKGACVAPRSFSPPRRAAPVGGGLTPAT